MPQIDPKQLLKTLGILLSPTGGIKSSEEVERLVKLMSKFSRKLVSKCIYVQILSATPCDLLTKFLHEGGWSLLNTWFEDAIKTQNWPMVKEMLFLFDRCPVTAKLLKEQTNEHNAPKLINQLRQESSVQTEIRGLASDVYKSWVAVVSQKQPSIHANDPENGDSVSLLQSLADEVADSLKKPELDEESLDLDDFPKIRKVPTVQKPKSTIIDGSIKINKKNLPSSHPLKDAAKKSEKDKESSSKRRSSDNKEKDKSSKRFRPHHRDEVNSEEKQRIKDLANRLKEEAQAKKEKEKTTTSSLGKIPKIPKKTPVTSSSSPSDADSKKVKSFEEMLGGLDSKPKTVKTTSIVKNKTAALLEGMKSHSSKSSSSSSLSSSSSSKSSSSSSKRDRDHHHSSSHHKRDHHHSSSRHSSSRKEKVDKKLSLNLPATPESNSKKKDTGTMESPKSAKSPQVYAESSSFMDALFSSMGVPTARKKKRRLSESKDEKSPPAKAVKKDSVKEESKEESGSPTNNSTENTPAFSFYQDTLESKEATEEVNENGDKTANEEVIEKKDDTNEEDVEMNESTTSNGKEEPEQEEELPFAEPDTMPREVKGILVYHRGRDKRDKKITWRPETDLVAVQYFEVDENERVNVNKLKFENMREFESKMEKAAMKSKAFSDEGDTLSTIPWYRMKPIKVTNREPFEPGTKSKEKDIQNDREKGVLQEIYFTREMTPDTPKEADPDTNSMKSGQPIIIPTEDSEADVNGVMHYANKTWPEPKENQVSKQAQMESQFSLPPALSSLLSSINKTGIEGIIPPQNLNAMSKEEQDTLMAQTEAMKKLGMLPPVNSQPPLNEPPPSIPPPSDFRVPPPGNQPPPFNGPPPFASGPPPPSNGFYQQPNGPPPFNNRGDYHSNGHGNNGSYRGYRSSGGPPQRGGYRDNYNNRGGYQENHENR